MKHKTISVIEDDPDIQEVISYNLNREGFEVQQAISGEDGLSQIQSERPDLVLLDLMLPGIDGLEVCRRLKSDNGTAQIPIIILSAKNEESDIVIGLGLGADDYITKPFKPRELVARVHAAIRKNQKISNGANNGPNPVGIISSGPLVIDTDMHKTSVAGVEVMLTVTEFRVLSLLAAIPGKAFSREDLISLSLGENVDVVDRNIDVHIRAIRNKLGKEYNFIETIRGVGYRFRSN